MPEDAILQLVASTNRRGAEVFAAELGEELRRLGRRVHTMALSPGGGGHTLELPTVARAPRSPAAVLALRRAAAGAPALVAHGSTTLPTGVLALAGLPTPLVYRSIGDPRYWSGSGWRRRRTALLLRRAARVVALWRGAADALVSLHRLDPARIRVIPNAVRAERFAPVSATERRLARRALGLDAELATALYLGALTREKRVEAAVEAIAHLPGAQLAVVGDGPEGARLRALAAGMAPERVHFLGATAEPARALGAADVVVLPSETEGMPAVLIEAGLMAIPAVATDVGGVSEVVVEGRTGRLVRHGETGALVEALRAVLANPGAMGEAARLHCQRRFDMAAVAAQWAALLDEVTSGQAARR